MNKQSILALINKNCKSNIEGLFELDLHDSLESTNSYLMEQILTDKIKICVAESQSNGRGRHGKIWYSPPKSNIYLSFAHQFDTEIADLSGLSLMVGITLADTLQTFCSELIQVKWPNDLLVKGKKLSGILIELKKGKNVCKVIIGIGINVAMPAEADNNISQSFISLNQCQPYSHLSRNEITAAIISSLLGAVQVFDAHGFEIFRQRWNKLDAWYEKPVVLQIGNKTISGEHAGIDQNGALLLDINGKLTSWCSGEVSLRSAS